jgi:rhamnosyltransferase
MEPNTCSIVIRAYNEESHIDRLLQGINQQTFVQAEVVLVDSGSTDRTVEIAENAGVKVVHIEPTEFTFGRSLNLGISNTTNELVVLASAHVYPVYPDWLAKLLEPFQDDKVALTYGKQCGGTGSKFSEKQIFNQWFPNGARPIQDHPFCNNANAALRKSLWEEYPYDETLPGLEDLDWANRIMLRGKIIRYVPEAEIIHVHQETPGGVYHRYQREGMAFKRIFPQERFTLWDFVRLVFTTIHHDANEARRGSELNRVWSEIIWFRMMQFWGTYRGYHQSGPLTWQLKQRFYYPNQEMKQDGKKLRDITPIRYNE